MCMLLVYISVTFCFRIEKLFILPNITHESIKSCLSCTILPQSCHILPKSCLLSCPVWLTAWTFLFKISETSTGTGNIFCFVLGKDERSGVGRYHFFPLNGHLSYLRHTGKHGKHECTFIQFYTSSWETIWHLTWAVEY